MSSSSFLSPPLSPSVFLGHHLPSPTPSLSPCTPPQMAAADPTPSPPSWFRSFTSRFTPSASSRPNPKEFRTMTNPPHQRDYATFKAKVLHLSPVSPSAQHLQLVVQLADTNLYHKHTTPGQFVQLARQVPSPHKRRPQRNLCLATIASAPGAVQGIFEFLIAKANDPLRLASLKQGDSIDISPVMGAGLDYTPVIRSRGDLHMFVDAPQGFAAVKSLIEWEQFRAASGEGANRTNYVTVYYAIPSGADLPYADRLSAWSVYGVNVVPLPGLSVLEYLSTKSSIGRMNGSTANDFAIGCVAANDTFEALFCSLILYGFSREAIHRYTQESVAQEAFPFQQGVQEDEREEKPFGMPDDTYQQMKRNAVEREIWESWVRIREELREEFEVKWAAQSKTNREKKMSEEEKQQAWASWCARNKDRWSQVEWDASQWNTYWTSWGSAQDSWASKNGNWSAGGGGGGGSSHFYNNGRSGKQKQQWNQRNAQEYWDWVAKGAGRGASSAGSGGRGGRGAHQTYSETYGGSQTWGNANNGWSGYEKGGYKYEYQETEKDKQQHQQWQNGKSSSGSQSGWGNWNQGWAGNWWNRNAGGNRQSSNSNERNWNSRRSSSFGELDFYSVLGIDAGASKSEIKKAYRRKAMEHHPDRNRDKQDEAHAKMKEIVVAWSVLKDDYKRRQYDQHGPGGL